MEAVWVVELGTQLRQFLFQLVQCVHAHLQHAFRELRLLELAHRFRVHVEGYHKLQRGVGGYGRISKRAGTK